MAILARHLASHCIEHHLISPLQKGFMPYKGCFEHSFILHSLMEDSKRRCTDLRIVWFNLKNAFGSVPHYIIFDMMSRIGIPPVFIQLCRDIYHDSSTSISTSSGSSAPIHQASGIKQGCPLSPLLLNIALQGLLLGLDRVDAGYSWASSSTPKIRYLAYADDLCFVGHSKEDIQALNTVFETFLKWSGMQLKPAKCCSLSCINSSYHKYVQSFSLQIAGFSIRPLKWGDRYRYLGVDTGRVRLDSLKDLEVSISTDVKSICNSSLTDWQKVDAINSFIIPRSTYHLRAALPSIGWASNIDTVIRPAVKKGLKLPRCTITPLFYTNRQHGGLSLFSISDNLVVALLSQMFRCLTSPDKIVSDIVLDQLRQTVTHRSNIANPSMVDLQLFMNSPIPATERTTRDVKSLWSDARLTLLKSDLYLDLSTTPPCLTSNDVLIVPDHPRGGLNSYLRARFRAAHLQSLCSARTRVGPIISFLSRLPAVHGSTPVTMFPLLNTVLVLRLGATSFLSNLFYPELEPSMQMILAAASAIRFLKRWPIS